ncbi:MAG: ATP-binding protein [Cyanobacteria bacterium P01_D01_bin.1]
MSFSNRQLGAWRPTLLQILIVLFILPLTGSAVLIQYLAWRNEQKAIEQLVRQLQQQVGDRIQERIITLTEAPVAAVDNLSLAIRRGDLDPDDLSDWEAYLTDQGVAFDDLTFLYFGNRSGDYVELHQSGSSLDKISLIDGTQPEVVVQSYAGPRGRIATQQTIEPFDPRERPWYKSAAETQKPRWTEPYEFISDGMESERYGRTPPTVGISFVRPYYVRSNVQNEETLAGVIGADLALLDIDRFLNSLDISESGQAFILDHNGRLLARSEVSSSPDDSELSNSEASSKGMLVELTKDFLMTPALGLQNIAQPQMFQFGNKRDKNIVQVSPYLDQYGLNWFVVVVVPESDFTGTIRDQARVTLLFSAGIVTSMFLLTVLIASCLSHSVLRISSASQAVATGDLSYYLSGFKVRELDKTAKAFNHMAYQLRSSYSQMENYSKSLEREVRKRTQELEQEVRDRTRSEETFKTLVANMPGTVYRCRLDEACTMEFISEAVFDLCGYPASDFIENKTRNFNDIGLLEDNDIRATVAEAVEQRRPYVLEYQIVHADGSIRSVYGKGRGIFDDEGELLYLEGVLFDITPLKRAEAAIKASEQRYRSLFEDAPIGLWEEDFSEVNRYLRELGVLSYPPKASAEPDDKSDVQNARAYFDAHPQVVRQCIARVRILKVNRAALSLFEIGQEIDLLSIVERNQNISAIEQFKQEIISLCEGQNKYETEIVRYASTGQVRHLILREFIASGHEQDWSRVIVSTTDISQRKQAEAQLQISEEKYRTLNESTQDAAILISRYRFIDCNPATLKMFGCETKAEFCRRLLGDFSPKLQPDGRNSRRVMRATVAAALSAGIYNFEWYHQRSDGTIFPSEVRLTSMELAGDRVVQAVVRDTTLRKRAEADIIQAKQKAEIANQAKSQFLANMSHELRSPLNAILGFTQVMSRSDTLPAEHQENVSIINRSGEFLLGLINDILDIAKIEAGHTVLTPSSFNLHTLLDELYDLFKLKAEEKQIQLVAEKSPALPQYIYTDRAKLYQVLINLLDNAIKFTHAGTITLQAQTGTQSEKQSGAPSASSLLLYFSVADTGAGIASDEIDQLFQPFVQTESGLTSQKGTGLGLAICRKFVQIMGGEISIDSQLEQGTTISFYIQPTAAAAGAIDQPRFVNKRCVLSLAAEQPRYKILIVDDEAVNRQLLFKLLEPVGFELQAANNGQTAIEMTRNWQPDLVLMDLRMPVLDGMATTRLLRRLSDDEPTAARQPSLKIIALSASSLQSEQAEAIAAGCDDFIRKPLRDSEIFEAIAQQLGACYTYAEASQSEESPSELSPYTEEQSQESQSQKSQHEESQSQESHHINALSTLSAHTLSALESATLRLQWDEIFVQIETIRAVDETLANRLSHAVENFRYDQIIGSIQTAKTKLLEP